MKKNQHVVPSGDRWAVRGEGNSRKTRITQTQREAIEIARTIARKEQSELVIHGKMVVLDKKIVMVTILFLQEVRI